MNAKKPKRKATCPASDTLSHTRDLLLSLSRVARSIQRAHTTEDFYQVIGEEIKSLGGEVTLLMIDKDARSPYVVYTSYAPPLLRQIEKLTGKSALGYQLEFSPNSPYARILQTGEAEYVHWTVELIAEALPPVMSPLAAMFLKILKFVDSILAPLIVDGETLGLMVIGGSFLDENDLAVMEVFAGQIAVGLRNVRLLQKLQDELTARREAEKELHISQDTFEGIFNSLTEAVYIQSENGVFVKVNRGAEIMYGYPSEYFVGRTPEFLSAPGKNDLAKVVEFLREAYLGETVEFEFWGRRKDGSIFPKDVRLSPGLYFGEKVVLAVGRDISERKQAEGALIRSEQAYRALFENMPIGLYRTSMHGHILDANQALVDMFAYPDLPSLLKMKTEDLYVSPASNIGFKEDSFEMDGRFTFEAEFRRYDQGTFWAEDNFQIVYNHDGVPQFYEGSLIDITTRKNAEAEQLHAAQSLESAHRDLQHSLANEQMLARIDGLTSLYNRRYFHEIALREFIAAIRYQRPLTIMLFDLDGLKQINDTFGHELGDTFLMRVAEVAASQLRNVDVLARYGGDEFIILFPETNARDAYLIAERFRATIESVKVATGGDPLSATISAGIAEIDHARLNKSVEDTIRFADKAMYQAKQKGRNCIEIYAPGANDD